MGIGGARRPQAQSPGERERKAQASGGRAVAGGRRVEGVLRKKMSTPTGRREALQCLTSRGLSERSACRHLGLSRRVATYGLKQPAKDRDLGGRLMATSQEFPRFGYRRGDLLYLMRMQLQPSNRYAINEG